MASGAKNDDSATPSTGATSAASVETVSPSKPQGGQSGSANEMQGLPKHVAGVTGEASAGIHTANQPGPHTRARAQKTAPTDKPNKDDDYVEILQADGKGGALCE